MLSIINIDRPQCALKLEGIGELKRLSANLSFVERNVRSTILNVLFSCYVLPWKNVATEKQDWKERVTEFSEFMLWLTQDWLNYNLNDGSKHTELVNNNCIVYYYYVVTNDPLILDCTESDQREID